MKKVESSKVPSRLRRARLLAGLTQQQLADRLGIQQSRISEYETGQHQPGAALYLRWLEACPNPES